MNINSHEILMQDAKCIVEKEISSTNSSSCILTSYVIAQLSKFTYIYSSGCKAIAQCAIILAYMQLPSQIIESLFTYN